MSSPKVFSGARGKLAVVDPATQTATVVGIFTSCSYGLSYDGQPVYVLGSYGPVEWEYTGQEPIGITCTGWRVVGHGPHVDAKVPHLQDLLRHEYLELTLMDRQNNDLRVAKFRNVRPTGYSTGVSSRQLSEVTVNFVGLRVDDESGPDNAESPGATQLPQT